MKKCPKCEMIVDAYSECPICNGDLVDQPHVEDEIEKYKLNKWFFMHLLKKHKFSIFCTIVTLVGFFITIKSFGVYHIFSLVILVFMWIDALFKNLSIKLSSHVYNENYIESIRGIAKYMSGIGAIACVLLMAL